MQSRSVSGADYRVFTEFPEGRLSGTGGRAEGVEGPWRAPRNEFLEKFLERFVRRVPPPPAAPPPPPIPSIPPLPSIRGGRGSEGGGGGGGLERSFIFLVLLILRCYQVFHGAFADGLPSLTGFYRV